MLLALYLVKIQKSVVEWEFVNMKIIYLLIVLLFMAVPANAQIVNGDFTCGDLSGWNVTFTYGGTVFSSNTVMNSPSGPDGNYARFGFCCCDAGEWGKVVASQEVDVTGYNAFSCLASQGLETGTGSWNVSIGGLSGSTSGNWDEVVIDISGLDGMQTVVFEVNGADRGAGGFANVRVDNIELSYTPVDELIIAGSSANQSWYVNQSLYPDLDIYFQEIVDYNIENFNASRDYYINCTSSNASYPYTYNFFIDDDNGDSMDNSIYSRMGMETKILYPDSPTTYTFHLYEINENIKDSFPWYYWFIYPLYMLVEMFADDPDVTVTELDAIAITLSKVSGDSETQPDIPDEPEDPDIPDPEPDPEPDPDPYVPPDPPDINDTAGNQTVNVSFTDGYYQTVNSTIDGFFSPVYNFTNWSCSPVTQLSSTISDFSDDMEGGFDFADSKIGLVSGAFSCVFAAFPPKIISMISFFLVLMVLLIIMGRDKN